MILDDFRHYEGQHCETTTTGCLLYQLGLELSEPMIFGLGEGFSFIYWKLKSEDRPFLGGRVKPDLLTENLCRNLELQLEVKETSSPKKAWENVREPLCRGKAVGLKLDCFHLEYFNTKIHFAGHYAAIYGYDEIYAYLVDTDQQGGIVRTKLENLAAARNERGVMSSRNKSFVINQVKEIPELKSIVKKAIHNNAVKYLNPPIKNVSYKGIKKTAKALKPCLEPVRIFQTSFHYAAH